MSVLLDTGVLFAYVYPASEEHEVAVSFIEGVCRRRFGTPVVSDLIMAELLTLVRARRIGAKGEEIVRSLFPLPESDLPGLVSFDVGGHAFQRVWDKFALHRDRRLSFVDASHLVLMEDHEIGMLATFDKGFDGLVPTVP